MVMNYFSSTWFYEGEELRGSYVGCTDNHSGAKGKKGLAGTLRLSTTRPYLQADCYEASHDSGISNKEYGEKPAGHHICLATSNLVSHSSEAKKRAAPDPDPRVRTCGVLGCYARIIPL